MGFSAYNSIRILCIIIVMEFVSGSASWNPINILRSGLAACCILVVYSSSLHASLLDKKNGGCSGPPTPKITQSDVERLATAKEYEERRRRGFKAALP